MVSKFTASAPIATARPLTLFKKRSMTRCIPHGGVLITGEPYDSPLDGAKNSSHMVPVLGPQASDRSENVLDRHTLREGLCLGWIRDRFLCGSCEHERILEGDREDTALDIDCPL